MARFLIEVPHEAEEIASTRVAGISLNTDFHFLTYVEVRGRRAQHLDLCGGWQQGRGSLDSACHFAASSPARAANFGRDRLYPPPTSSLARAARAADSTC